MADALSYLTFLAVMLIIGIICTIIGNRLKVSRLFLLLISGILISKFGISKFFSNFDPIFMTSISIIVLVMIVFDASSRYKLKEFDKISASAAKLVFIWIILNLIILTFLVRWLFDIPVFLAVIFALLMSGTSADVIVSLLKDVKGKIAEFLEIESIISKPLIVLLPLMAILMMQSFEGELLPAFFGQVGPFLQQFVVGVGSGIVVGFVAFKSSKIFPDLLSPFSVMTTALLTYIVAENLGGSGVLAIVVLGLLFGNMYVKEKEYLTKLSEILADSLVIIVFILLGTIIDIPITFSFIFKSCLLFIAFLLIRYIAIVFTIRKSEFQRREKIFMALNCQKGIAVATVAFTFLTTTITQNQLIGDVLEKVNVPFLSISGVKELLSLVIIFMIYSMILTIFVERKASYFVGLKSDMEKRKEEKEVEKIESKRWFMFDH